MSDKLTKEQKLQQQLKAEQDKKLAECMNKVNAILTEYGCELVPVVDVPVLVKLIQSAPKKVMIRKTQNGG
jgi:phage terminase Nu1 subunit (DNA packaging protein)